MSRASKDAPVFKFRLVASIMRNSGLGYVTTVFLALFIACSIIVAVVEPNIAGPFEAVWFCFQAVTTIGFGDVVVVTPLARVSTMVLSAFAVIWIAVFTGSVVSYCTERAKMRNDESLVHFIDKLEHLPELSRDELEEISKNVRKMR